MNRRKLLMIFLVAILSLGLMGSVLAVPVLTRSYAGSGSAAVKAGSFVLQGTVGEGIVSAPMTVGSTRLASGFWQDITWLHAYLPLMQRNAP